jgi:transglutaminase-like putative cysteine protease
MQSWAYGSVERRVGRVCLPRKGMLAALCVGAVLAAGTVRARAAAVAGSFLGSDSIFGSGSIFGSAEPVPDWVKTAVARKLPEFPGNPKAVVLLDETTYTVGADGRATKHVRYVVKILRPQGRDYGYPAVWYDKDSKVVSMHVWSIDAAGHEYSLKDNEIADVGAPGEGGELYSDDRAKVAEPPGRDPGGIIAYEYEKRERPYLAEANWRFQDDLPRMTQSFTLVLPQGYTYTTTWAHHAKVDGTDLENHHYRWEMDNEAAIDLDHVPMSPGEGSLSGRMTAHYAGPGLTEPQDGTWLGIGEWYAGLERDRLGATPDIAAKAAELTAGKTDFYDKAEAIGDFVQQKIRYVAIKLGVGGYQPHAAEDIFRGRYGDCKDKATLLSSMLSSVGIQSALLMVDTERGVIDPDDPSIVGNHMIGAIEIPKGYESEKLHSVVTAKTGRRYLIFDPTWDRTPFGQLEDNLQGSYGVLMEGDASQIIELPVMDPKLNTIRRKASFQLSADGSLKGAVTDLRYGDLAEQRRYVFSSEDEKKQQEYMNRILGRDFVAASLTGLKVENVDSLNKDLTTTFDLQAAHFASLTGPLLMVRPRVLGSYGLEVDHKARHVAINLEETMQGTDEYDIELPEGYVVDELPDPVKEDFGFASYVSSSEVRGRTLHYSRTYTVKQVTVPAAKYAEVQRLAAVIAADEDSRAILKRGN